MRWSLSVVLLAFVAVASCKDDPKAADGDPSAHGFDTNTSGGVAVPNGGNGNGNGNGNGTPKGDGGLGGVAPGTDVNTTTETMDFEGKARTYVLSIPKDVDKARSYPLVLSFHGNPGDAAEQASKLPFDVVSRGTAVVAYPQAAGDGWDQFTPSASNADMSWIKALPAEIAKKVTIDKAKVFGFGYSGGAFFLNNFTCRFNGVFKAISVAAGGGPDEEQSGFMKRPNECYVCPGGPIATLITHGALDDDVGRDSGEFTALCVSDTNGCTGDLKSIEPAPCKRYSGCPAGAPVEYCLIPGLAHGVWEKALVETWAFFSTVP